MLGQLSNFLYWKGSWYKYCWKKLKLCCKLFLMEICKWNLLLTSMPVPCMKLWVEFLLGINCWGLFWEGCIWCEWVRNIAENSKNSRLLYFLRRVCESFSIHMALSMRHFGVMCNKRHHLCGVTGAGKAESMLYLWMLQGCLWWHSIHRVAWESLSVIWSIVE